MKIQISVGNVMLEAQLLENQTAKAIYEALPLDCKFNTWGNEFYFGIPVQQKEENAKEIVEIGDIAYWPPGKAFCIFFGPTPASEDERPRAASPVNVFGKILGDTEQLKTIKSSRIRIETIRD